MEDKRNTEIGARVRKARKARAMTLQKLCGVLPEKISFQHLSNYENGASRWPAVLLSDVADALGVDISNLLGKV